MKLNQLAISLIFLKIATSASIPKRNDSLEVLRKDVSQVGSAIENFTFDILRGILEESSEEAEIVRKKRGTETHKTCQVREEAQINDLKKEVKKLKEIVTLLQEQQAVLKIVDTNQTEAESPKKASSESEEPCFEDLSKIKNDLQDVIKKLNQTREMIDLQKKKDEILEEELIKQKQELAELKNRTLNDTILQENEESSNARASEFSELRKLLKNLPEDDDDDEVRTKLKKIERDLSKKKRRENLLKELKDLEKNDDDESSNSQFFQQFLKALKKSEDKSRSDDLDVTNLSDLQEAINRLRPKEDQSAQFQAILNRLVNSQRPQEMSPIPQAPQIPKKCQRTQADYNRQFFPGPVTQPSYYPQGAPNGNNYEKPVAYQQENSDFAQRYQEDLRQQINNLQAAIDNLNRPEYAQKPEDQAVVANLEHQISDLRNVVNNLNYEPKYRRAKRSLENNEIDDKELVMLVDQILNGTEASKPEVVKIQQQIDSLKKQLDFGESNKARDASYPSFLPESLTEEKSSAKSNIFAEIIGNIFEKLLQALPAIVQRLFNFSFQELSKYDSQDYDLQVLSKNLGIFGILPIILVRILRGVSAFLKILRKNNFVKNFLLPAGILGTVAGSLLFLIWWLQPDGEIGGYIDYDQNNQYSPPPPQYPAAPYTPPVYTRSYINK